MFGNGDNSWRINFICFFRDIISQKLPLPSSRFFTWGVQHPYDYAQDVFWFLFVFSVIYGDLWWFMWFFRWFALKVHEIVSNDVPSYALIPIAILNALSGVELFYFYSFLLLWGARDDSLEFKYNHPAPMVGVTKAIPQFLNEMLVAEMSAKMPA